MPTAFDLWLADKQKRDQQAQQDAQNGTVNFQEASYASRPQYSMPQYSNTDASADTHTYQWMKDILGGMTGKGMGKSYNDKFNYLTNSLGMSPGQANDFRNYLNYQENQGQDIKLKKNGDPYTNQNVRLGQGMQLQNDQVNNILDGITQRGVQNVQYQTQLDQQAAQQAAQQEVAAKAYQNAPQNTVWQDIMNPAQRVMNVIKDPTWSNLMTQLQGNYNDTASTKRSAPVQEATRALTRISNAQAFGIPNELEKAVNNGQPYPEYQDRTGSGKIADTLYDLAGGAASVVPGAGVLDNVAGKAASKLVTNPYAQSLLKSAISGAGAMGAYGAIQQGAGAILNPNEATLGQRLGNIGEMAATGAVAGPILEAVAPEVTKAVNGILPRGQLDKLKQDMGYANYSDQAFQNALNEAYAPKGDVSNVVADTPKTPQDIPQPYTTKYPNLQTQVPKPTPPEDLNQLKNDIAQAQQLRQQHENDYVQQAMNPIYENQQRQAEAQQTWQQVKQDQATAQRIKDQYGKIYVPKTQGQTTDIQDMVPAQFRSSSTASGVKAPYDIYKFAEEEGFSSPEEAVQFLQNLDQSSKTRLKDLMPADSKAYNDQQLQDLENSFRQNFAGSSQGQAIDQLISHLQGIHDEASGVKPPTNPVSDRLASLVKPAETPTVEQTLNNPKSTENVNNSQAQTPNKDSLRMNLQFFDNAESPQLFATNEPVASKSPIESIQNPVMRKLNQLYENIASPTRSASVAEEQILKDAINRAQETGQMPKKVAQLQAQLKQVQRSGSDFSHSIQNQQASANLAREFSKGHIQNLQNALGTTDEKALSDALHYQVAKNADWIKQNVNPDYELGGRWDQGRINSLINQEVSNPKLKDFSNAFKQWSQQRLDNALKYNLISKSEHAALSKNPYYIPLSRDVSQGMDNVERGLKGGTTSNKSASGAYFLHSLDNGSADALIKNPLETMVNGDFSLFKNMAKADTGQQALRLAKLNKGASPDNVFAKEVSQKQYQSQGGIEVPTPKGTRYVQLQPELMKIMKEAEMPHDLDTLGKVTSFIAQLKTRAIPFQTNNVFRDVVLDGYMKGQIGNPIRYGTELWKAALNHNLSAKEAGAVFDHATQQGMQGINQDKLIKEFIRNNSNVQQFNPKSSASWKALTSTLKKIWDVPVKIGQFSDELPRSVEVNETKRLYMKQNGEKIANLQGKLNEINQRLDAAKGIQDPFHPDLQGIDKLQGQKAKIEDMLNQHQKDLQRQQTYRGRDLMNFQRVGRSPLAKRIKQYIMFANTTTQAKDKLIRSLIERPAQTMGKIALLTSPLIYSQYASYQNSSNSDKQVYDNLPYWFKQNNYTFVHNGQVITIPKQQELSILTNPLENYLVGDKEGVDQSLRTVAKEATPYQAGNLTQGLVPNTDGSVTVLKNSTMPGSGIEPLIDVLANKQLGLNQNPISNADHFNKKDAKANSYTMDIFKKMFGDTPRADYAEYLTRTLGGDYGRTGNYVLDFLNDRGNTKKLDALIQNLEPLQKRVYSNSSPYFQAAPHKSKATGK